MGGGGGGTHTTRDAKVIIHHPHKQTNVQLVWEEPQPPGKRKIFYCHVWCSVVQNITLANSGQLSQLCFLPASPSRGRVKKKASILCKYYSAGAKTWMCYQHCVSPKSKTQHRTVCYEEG